jgi:hypothetical protein
VPGTVLLRCKGQMSRDLAMLRLYKPAFIHPAIRYSVA